MVNAVPPLVGPTEGAINENTGAGVMLAVAGDVPVSPITATIRNDVVYVTKIRIQ